MVKKYDKDIFDVLVLGGGLSGTMAAVSVARMGGSVLVVEENGFLGGNLTAAGVAPMATFYAGKKQIVRGLTQELIDRLVQKGKSPGHAPDASNFAASVTPFDTEAMKVELEDMVLEAGGHILYHTMFADAKAEEGIIKSVRICNKAGLTEVRAKVYIDATGDADLSYCVGVPCKIGRDADGLTQPMTMMCKYCEVDVNRLRRTMIEGDRKNFERMHRDIRRLESMDYISIAQGFGAEMAIARSREEIHFNKQDLNFAECGPNGLISVNTTRILKRNALDPFSLSEAETEGRKQVQELDLFLHKYIPGFENAKLVSTGPQIGVRGTRQICGVYQLTKEDVLSGKHFPDEVCYSGYPIDIHSPTNDSIQVEYPAGCRLSCVPYSCMVTNEIRNLIITGRCISATFEAQAAIRVTATIGAMGHAAGVAAAIAVENGCATKDVDVKELRETLVKQNAYLE